MFLRSIVAPTLLVLAACQSRTELVVVVDTNLAAPLDVDAIAVTVTGPSGASRSEIVPITSASSLPVTLGLFPETGADGPVLVLAIASKNGAPIVTREARTQFDRGSRRILRLDLAQCCAGVSCGTDQTCGAGRCQSIDVDGASLPSFDGTIARSNISCEGPDAGAPDMGAVEPDMGLEPLPGCPADCGRANGRYGTAGRYTLVAPLACTRVIATMWGAGGGHSANSRNAGVGGVTTGTIPVRGGDHLLVVVGGAGGDASGMNGGAAGMNGGGVGGSGSFGGGGGGGFTGIFRSTVSQSGALLIAGGGGGAGSTGPLGDAFVGNGGGSSGMAGGTASPGGTQNGDTEARENREGSALQGGCAGYSTTTRGSPCGNNRGGSGGGGGGGGWYGGSGGADTTQGGPNGGGGGSGYVAPSDGFVTGGSTMVLSITTPNEAARNGAGDTQRDGAVIVRCE